MSNQHFFYHLGNDTENMLENTRINLEKNKKYKLLDEFEIISRFKRILLLSRFILIINDSHQMSLWSNSLLKYCAWVIIANLE